MEFRVRFCKTFVYLQLNAGKWVGVEAASPSVLMQLLQKWFRGFEQPTVSESQQTAMLALLDTQDANKAVSCSAVQQQNAHGANPALGMTEPAAAAPLVHQELHVVASQRNGVGCVAAITSLPVLQRTLIDRVVKCVVAITEQSINDGSRQVLLQWLATALTSPCQCGTNSTLNMQQEALLRVLEHCASSSEVVQNLSATPVQPTLGGLPEAAVLTQNITASESADAQARASACQLDVCTTAEACSSSHAKIAAHLPGTADAGVVQDPQALGRPDQEVGHSNEDGCMWFHKRAAKNGLRRLHEHTRQTASPY